MCGSLLSLLSLFVYWSGLGFDYLVCLSHFCFGEMGKGQGSSSVKFKEMRHEPHSGKGSAKKLYVDIPA